MVRDKIHKWRCKRDRDTQCPPISRVDHPAQASSASSPHSAHPQGQLARTNIRKHPHDTRRAQQAASHGTVVHCTALHCTALHCTALHCTALHCTALHCTARHSTAQHSSSSSTQHNQAQTATPCCASPGHATPSFANANAPLPDPLRRDTVPDLPVALEPARLCSGGAADADAGPPLATRPDPDPDPARLPAAMSDPPVRAPAEDGAVGSVRRTACHAGAWDGWGTCARGGKRTRKVVSGSHAATGGDSPDACGFFIHSHSHTHTGHNTQAGGRRRGGAEQRRRRAHGATGSRTPRHGFWQRRSLRLQLHAPQGRHRGLARGQRRRRWRSHAQPRQAQAHEKYTRSERKAKSGVKEGGQQRRRR
jgi:hypothetical protein